ncbi:activator-dependent family glycosyltransferase [Marinactinospora rubrisoli]|uniref:Activator-dependent family glycosyltransferase n=1 Tax=Marinactinospora rubrisoli TaxID=2715399 RepID=A0ABW2KQ06_9ACTN
MRVLMTSFAQHAHFNGSVPLAWALRTAGHEVRVASHPALTPAITAAGLTAVPVGTDHPLDTVMRNGGPALFAPLRHPDFLENRPDRLDHDTLRYWDTVFTALVYAPANDDTVIDDLVRFTRHWRADLVIWEPFTFSGAVAARAAGAAHARLLSFPDMFLSTRAALLRKNAAHPAAEHDDALGEWLTWTIDRHGHPYDEEIVTGQWTIDQMPPSISLSLGQPTVPMRYIPYNGPAVVPAWLRSPPARPRVCLTLGTTTRSSAFPDAVSLRATLDALSDLDIEVVATLDAAQLATVGTLPANTRAVEYVPLHALLPTCAAIVHHGGAGTWSTAAVHGVPQVTLGWMWDAVYRARRLQDLEAGLFLPSGELTPAALRDRLVRLLSDPRHARGAARLRDEMLALPAPNDVVRELERRTEAAHRRTAPAPIPAAAPPRPPAAPRAPVAG